MRRVWQVDCDDRATVAHRRRTIGQTVRVSGHPSPRRWTIASWHLGDRAHEHDDVVAALDGIEPDAIALQGLTARSVRSISTALDLPHVWARSHYPTSRLIPGSSIGLAVLTPHRITSAAAVVVSGESSLWSSARRIMQTATILRPDHSSYAINHRFDDHGGSTPVATPESAPVIDINPARPMSQDSPRIDVPAGATTVSHQLLAPLDGAPPIGVTQFDMVWVQGGFAAS